MTIRAWFLLLAVSACAADDPHTNGSHLSSDAYFTGVLSPYTTLDQCMAVYADVHECAFELALCQSGAVGQQRANAVYDGSYHLEGQHAVGALDDVAFDIDVETGFTDADNLGPVTWTPDVDRLWQTPPFDLLHCP